jgi:hypothetical protein
VSTRRWISKAEAIFELRHKVSYATNFYLVHQQQTIVIYNQKKNEMRKRRSGLGANKKETAESLNSKRF